MTEKREYHRFQESLYEAAATYLTPEEKKARHGTDAELDRVAESLWLEKEEAKQRQAGFNQRHDENQYRCRD